VRQQLQRHVAPVPDLDAALEIGQTRHRMGRGEDAATPGGALDSVARNQAKHQVGPLADGADQLGATLLAEPQLDLVRFVLERRHDLAVVAARGTPTRLVGVQHQHRTSALGEIKRRGESRVASTDHDDLRRLAAVERRNRRAGRGSGRPVGIGYARRIV
jgi:hypothetical protein